MQLVSDFYMIGKKRATSLARLHGTSLYAYDASLVRDRYRMLRSAVTYADSHIYYACKANTNETLMRVLYGLGCGIETVSLGEIAAAKKAGVPYRDMIFTGDSLSDDEFVRIARTGVHMNLDSLRQIEQYGKLGLGASISIRVNQGIGAGHHSHVITGGPDSKFGIYYTQLAEATRLARRYKLTITGLHQHIGSNVLSAAMLIRAADALLATAATMPSVTRVNFGGGLGVPYQSGQAPLDVARFGALLSKRLERFTKRYGRKLRVDLEPGRYFVAEAGTLLVTVTDVKQSPKHTFVGVNSGFNHLVRPAMYGSYHEIVNVTRPTGTLIDATIVGNICESGDVFGAHRPLVSPKVGDVLGIRTAGAYGYSMSSTYNLHDKPHEVVV